MEAPGSEDDVRALVAAARDRHAPLRIEGGGTRGGLGRPVQAGTTLSLRSLTGVTLYEPAELVIGARAGTPLTLVESTLADRGQRLPFEPMDHRALYGTQGEPTIGAVAACNISGPRRIAGGAARDHLIGLRFVNGEGQAIKSGGRVMKNVTGLDLVKLQAGAHGTLGVLTETIFKVLPVPETTATLVLHGLDDTQAVAALSTALGSPFEPTGAAHLTAGVGGADARTLLRVEGYADQVAYRLGALAERLAQYGAATRLEDEASQLLWRDIRDCLFLVEPRDACLWKLAIAPSRAAAAVARIMGAMPARALYDCGGSLVWLACDAQSDAGASTIRAALSGYGHATLVCAPEPLRATLDVFTPLTPAKMALTRGIKKSFDPAGIINPGRMYAGV